MRYLKDVKTLLFKYKQAQKKQVLSSSNIRLSLYGCGAGSYFVTLVRSYVIKSNVIFSALVCLIYVFDLILTLQLATCLYLSCPYFLSSSWLVLQFGVFFKYEKKKNKYVPIFLCFCFVLVFLFSFYFAHYLLKKILKNRKIVLSKNTSRKVESFLMSNFVLNQT